MAKFANALPNDIDGAVQAYEAMLADIGCKTDASNTAPLDISDLIEGANIRLIDRFRSRFPFQHRFSIETSDRQHSCSLLINLRLSGEQPYVEIVGHTQPKKIWRPIFEERMILKVRYPVGGVIPIRE